MKNKKELPICCNPIYTAFLEYAFPCAILQSDRRLQNLLYVSFLNLYWDDNCDGKLQLYNFDLFDYLIFDNRIIDKTIINIDSKIINAIKKWLNEGYYIYAFLDESLLKETQLDYFSGKMHESLIYGYDDNFCSFQILNFNKERRFGTISINQKLLKKACLSKSHQTKFILLKPNFDMVNIELKLIEKRIDYYLNGKNIRVGKCRNILFNDYKWGIYIYDSLFSYVDKNITLDFRIFKLLEEHKVYLYNVFKYLLKLLNFIEVEKDFLELVDTTKKMNLYILRQNMVDKSEQKYKIREFLCDIRAKEEILLKKIQKEILKYINQHDNYNIEYLD